MLLQDVVCSVNRKELLRETEIQEQGEVEGESAVFYGDGSEGEQAECAFGSLAWWNPDVKK